jgi:predicted short-subunit dehydrogenase-like oxidoreductase (DUF2520 family)
MKVVGLGSGNVATHLLTALNLAGNEIVQVWSRNLEHAVVLAEKFQADAVSDLDQINQEADLYLIAVKDSAIETVAGKLKGVKGLVIHTSGATGLQALAQNEHSGVFYPLQTFSKSKAVDFRQIPVCIEAGEVNDLEILKTLARQITEKCYVVDSHQRKVLHLSAVFACNFTNYLYDVSAQILKAHQLDFEMIKPLILETAAKIEGESPFLVQTGPAVRNDELTIQAHMALLDSTPEFKQIYEILSNGIKKTHS